MPDDAVFAALADTTRRSILDAVAEQGPVTATALAGQLPISRQAVAKHLALLREAGLVADERVGRETRFVARAEPLAEIATWAERTGHLWEHRLERLRAKTTRSGGTPGTSTSQECPQDARREATGTTGNA